MKNIFILFLFIAPVAVLSQTDDPAANFSKPLLSLTQNGDQAFKAPGDQGAFLTGSATGDSLVWGGEILKFDNFRRDLSEYIRDNQSGYLLVHTGVTLGPAASTWVGLSCHFGNFDANQYNRISGEMKFGVRMQPDSTIQTPTVTVSGRWTRTNEISAYRDAQYRLVFVLGANSDVAVGNLSFWAGTLSASGEVDFDRSKFRFEYTTNLTPYTDLGESAAWVNGSAIYGTQIGSASGANELTAATFFNRVNSANTAVAVHLLAGRDPSAPLDGNTYGVRLKAIRDASAEMNFVIATPTGLTATATERFWIMGDNGAVGIGVDTADAALHLKSGTTTFAPLKMNSGTNLTTPEAGAIEFDGTNLFYTTDALSRQTIAPLSVVPDNITDLTISSDVDWGGNRITNLGSAEIASDAVTKAQLDSASVNSWGEMFVTGADPDTISFLSGSTTPAKPTDLTEGETTNFTYATGRLTYTGTNTHLFKLDGSVSFSFAENNTEIEAWFYKNGVEVSKTEIHRSIGTGGDIGNAHLSGIIQLATNDYIEIFFAPVSHSGNDDLIIESCNVSVVKM